MQVSTVWHCTHLVGNIARNAQDPANALEVRLLAVSDLLFGQQLVQLLAVQLLVQLSSCLGGVARLPYQLTKDLQGTQTPP